MTGPESASVETLKAIAAAFNAHDLDAIMDFMADDCSLDMPRGPDPWGKRFTGKAAVREGLASRFKGCRTSTTVTTGTGSAATWACRSGF
ncbi:MAG TPA: nuclear transport factor 2 family protein [Methylomirabilota bacterium]